MSLSVRPVRRRWLIAALASLALPAAPAWADTVTGSGRMQTETRALSGFTGVHLEASIKLVVRQSGTEAVQLRGDDNLLPLIETFVESRSGRPTLVVRWQRRTSIRNGNDIVVTVDMARIESLATAGSGSIEAAALKAESLRLSIAGSGDIAVGGLDAGSLDAAIAGSGDIKVAGRAGEVAVRVAGSGDADLSALSAERARVSIAGSGDVDLNADQALSVSIAGSGDVRYGGSVTEVKRSVVGSGEVRRR